MKEIKKYEVGTSTSDISITLHLIISVYYSKSDGSDCLEYKKPSLN
jgi:hypothetical protein